MEKILIFQFIAHIMADFVGQPECLSKKKQENGFGKHLCIHVVIVFATSWLLTLTYSFLLYSVGIAIMHFAVDYLKSIIEHYHVKKLKKKLKDKDNKKYDDTRFYTNHYIFVIDQFLHISVIFFAIRLFWKYNHSLPAYVDFLSVNQLLIIAGILTCLKPSNILIRTCLASFNLFDTYLKDKKEEEGLLKAGRWIGSLERLLALIFVLLNQYSAIGFIIAAKSVLRYGDGEKHKTEYVLIGTLLSFGLAVSIGIMIQSGIFEKVLNIICCL